MEMTENPNMMLTESLVELSKLIELMEEDANNLTAQQAIGDYIAPILGSMLAEIEANRQYVLQAADRANLAILMNEKTFLGEIISSIAEHFATLIEELPEDTDADSKIGVAVTEIQDLIATWMSFDLEDEDEDEDDDADDDDDSSMDGNDSDDLADEASEETLEAEEADEDEVFEAEVITDAES
jgi:hypothetical protein